jgi:hypothetical protein
MRVLLAVLLCACASSSGPAPPATPRPQEGQPLEEWLLQQMDRDPTVRDRLDEVLQPLARRIVFDRRRREVRLLPRDLPEDSLLRYSANAQKDAAGELAGDGEDLALYLSSGGAYNVVTLSPGLSGHFDVTREVLGEAEKPWSFSQEAAAVVADAARDPDFFAWGQPEAHAQTANQPGGSALHRPEVSEGCFRRWVLRRLLLAEASGRGGDLRMGLYHLGWALHAVQDLAPHRGMSNAEHAYLSGKGQDPDADPASVERARALTRVFLKDVAAPVLGRVYQALRGAQGVGRVRYPELTGQRGFVRDLTLAEYRAYKALGPRFLPAHHRTWYEGDAWSPVMDVLGEVARARKEPPADGCLADVPAGGR